MIDGDRWISQRLAFLREALAGDLPDEQRQAIVEEIELLRNERGIHHGGPRFLHLPRRLTAWGRARGNRPGPSEPAGGNSQPDDGEGRTD